MPRFEKLEGDQCFGIIMPNIQAALFGVSRIDQDKSGTATLHYTDGTTESAILDYDVADKGGVHVIGDVQEKARKEAA
jgi:hypothetical protein